MKMEYAIIAAGEGQRLKDEGFPKAKPLLTLLGVPMIERLINIFADQGAKSVFIIINEKNIELHEFLVTHEFSIPIHLLVKNTISSLHSFVALQEAFPKWESCCLTTTDTVFDPKTFGRYIKEFQQGNMDGLFAVTPFVDDESPLYVTVDHDKRIVCFQITNIRSRYLYLEVFIVYVRMQCKLQNSLWLLEIIVCEIISDSLLIVD